MKSAPGVDIINLLTLVSWTISLMWEKIKFKKQASLQKWVRKFNPILLKGWKAKEQVATCWTT